MSSARPGRADRRLGRPAWWFVGGYGLSAVGTGLFLPAVVPIIARLSGGAERGRRIVLYIDPCGN